MDVRGGGGGGGGGAMPSPMRMNELEQISIGYSPNATEPEILYYDPNLNFCCEEMQ